jgi:hypothetical protein
MKSFGSVLSFVLALALTGSSSWAGVDRDGILEDVTVVNNGEGDHRILFRTSEMPFSEKTVIQRATLTLPYSGASEERALSLRIHPITESWRGFDTEFDRDVYASAGADLNRGSGTDVFDMTSLMKEILEDGMTADGFVLTVASEEREGLSEDDASRFASMEGAELKVTTTVLPSGHPRGR